MKKAYQNSVDTKKVHTGTIKFMDLRKGYGFVVDNETGKEIFFHHSNIEEGRTFTGFVADDIIEFTLKPGAKGIEANCMVLSVPVEEQNNVDEESQEEEVSEEEIDEDSVEEDEEVPEDEQEDDDGGRLTEAEMAALAAISSSLSSGVNATEDIQEEINYEREEGEETVEKVSVVEETVVSKPHSSEEIVQGYLVERRKNKSVIRNFYYDENHVDEIIGEKGKKYINLSDENKTVYIWNGRNYINKTTPNKKTEEVQAEDNDTIVVRRKK